MKQITDYPGTLQHQTLLRGIVSHYQNDPRIQVVVLFGSLSRGTWDAYSDIDLDVVIAEGIVIDVAEELKQLSHSLEPMSEKAVLIIPDGKDAGEIVFESLNQLSIRYHPLSVTSPNIIDSVQVLTGSLDEAAVIEAGLANRQQDHKPLRQLLDECLRYIAVANVALQRGNIWLTVEIVHRIRTLLMEIFTRSRQGQRSYYFFEQQANAHLQTQLGKTLPQYHLKSLQETVLQIINILAQDINELASGQLHLSDSDHKLLESVRLKLVNDDFNVLKYEFHGEDGAFLLKIRTNLEWDRVAFLRLVTAMRTYCENHAGSTVLERWLAWGFWYFPQFTRDWTTHPNFPRLYSEKYYKNAYQLLDDLAYWFFVGESPYMNETGFDLLIAQVT